MTPGRVEWKERAAPQHDQKQRIEQLRERLTDLIEGETKRAEDAVVDPPQERPFVHITTDGDDLKAEIVARPLREQGRDTHPLKGWRDVKSITGEDVLRFLDSVDAPAVTTEEVAHHFNIPSELASSRLNQLYEEGRVNRRKSAQTMTWWESEQQDLLRGFGTFSDTDIPELMREEREEAREEWENDDGDDTLSG